METPKLETVPEETEAQPVSSPTNKHITADVPKTVPATGKNPGRVESGRKLAARNQAWLARLKNELKQPAPLQTPTQNQNQPPQQAPAAIAAAATPPVISFLGLVVYLSPLWGCITNAKPL